MLNSISFVARMPQPKVDPIYQQIVRLMRDLQEGKKEFKPEELHKTDYFDEYVAGQYDQAKVILCSGYDRYHYCIMYALGEQVMYFNFHPDGSITNVKYKVAFLTDETAETFAEEMKKGMKVFIDTHPSRSTQKFASLFQSKSKTSIKNIHPYLDRLHHLHNEILTKTMENILSTKKDLEKEKEHLSLEDNHQLYSLTEERLPKLIEAFLKFPEDKQQEKKDIFLESLLVISDRVHALYQKQQEMYEIDFEKQVRLINKKRP
jgi:hypothetical protein